jgi:DNA-binding transcriptional regulator PaaX
MTKIDGLAIRAAMTAKRPEGFAERDEAGSYRLSDAQAREVARVQRDIREGKAVFATDEQMEILWKSCGL